jgi:cell wall-associated NlpC family hydrolase
MTLNLQPSVHGVQSPRRRWLLAGAAAAGLAACSSGSARRDAAPADATTSTGVPPSRGNQAATQPPLALNPAAREEVVARAMLLINTPYTYGGNTPRGGFDCSGLVQYVIGQSLLDDTRTLRRLPRSTAQWAAATNPVNDGALQRGDLVFFNTTGAAFSHMGIYVGQGQFVHAPSSGGTVRKEAVASRYFGPRYIGARSVFAA